VFLVSLLPFFLTNVALSGNPLKPPRTLTPYEGEVLSTPPTDESAGGEGLGPLESLGSLRPFGSTESGGPTDPGGSPTSTTAVTAVARVGETLLAQVARFTGFLAAGLGALGDPDRLYHVFLRGGYLPDVAVRDGGKAINLSLVESAPLFGAFVVLPRAVVARTRRGRPALDAVVATDLFAAAVSLLFVLVYLPRLPLHAMVTLRYLVPMMPLLVYAVFRLRAVRDLLRRPAVLAFSFAGTVLFGTQLLFALLFVQRATLGEAVQAHALLALVAATLFAGWLLVEPSLSARVERPDRLAPVGTVLLGVVCGVTTSFLLLSGSLYFVESGDLLLSVVGRVVEAVSWL
jgi:hypothetical protein